MKALAVYPATQKIGIVDHPEPRISVPNQVKLKMLDVGVCGTDKEIAHFDYGTPPDGSDYLILGHESLGEVVEAGAAVTRVKPGDLAIPTVRRPCPHDHCLACRAGRQDFCYTGDFTERGIKQRHGFMAEFVVEDEAYLNPVPASLRDVGVLVEPLTIAEKAVTQLWQIQQRLPWACPLEPGKQGAYCHTALVLGAGPVGLLGAMKLVHEGFETFVYSRMRGADEKKQLVEAIGARFIDAEEVSVDQMFEQIRKADVVYEAVGASSLAFEVMMHLGANGVFIFTGIPGRKTPINVDADRLTREIVLRNQMIYGTVNAPIESFVDAIRDLTEFRARWPEQVQQLISRRVPIEQTVEALTGPSTGIKTVIAIH